MVVYQARDLREHHRRYLPVAQRRSTDHSRTAAGVVFDWRLLFPVAVADDCSN